MLSAFLALLNDTSNQSGSLLQMEPHGIARHIRFSRRDSPMDSDMTLQNNLWNIGDEKLVVDPLPHQITQQTYGIR